jgi:hypothetical protein
MRQQITKENVIVDNEKTNTFPSIHGRFEAKNCPIRDFALAGQLHASGCTSMAKTMASDQENARIS